MNKIESRHRLIRSLVLEKKIHTQQELQDLLKANGVTVTQSTLSRDIKALNLVKVHEADISYYIINSMAPSRWEKRLRLYGRCLDYVASCSTSSCHENSSWIGTIIRFYLRCSRIFRNCRNGLR